MGNRRYYRICGYIFCLIAGLLLAGPLTAEAAGLTAEQLEAVNGQETEILQPVETSADLSKAAWEDAFQITGAEAFYASRMTLEQPAELVFSIVADQIPSEAAVKVELYRLDAVQKPLIQKQLLTEKEKCEFFDYFEEGDYVVIFRQEAETESGSESAAGTVSEPAAEVTAAASGKMTVTAYQAGDFTAEAENVNYIGFGNNTPVYVKLPVKTSGRITLIAAMQDGEQISGIKYAFCDSDKKFLSWGTTGSEENYSKVFCVKKGTYYLKLTPSMGKFKVKFKVVPYDLKKNTSMDRAKKLKWGKYRYLTVPLGKNHTEQHYYKFTLKKPTMVKLSADFSGLSGEARFVMYKDGKLVTLSGTGVLNLGAGKSFTFQWKNEKGTIVKWPAGEYIIKVGKDRGHDTNGIVRLKITK